MVDEDYLATELDCLVASKIMDCLFWLDKDRDQVVYRVKGELFPWDSCMTPGRKRFEKLTPEEAAGIEFYEKPPRYSKKIKQAWEVVEKLSDRAEFSLTKTGKQWTARFGRRSAVAKTAEKAICLAALGKKNEA